MSNVKGKASETPLSPDDLTFKAELNWDKQSVAAEKKSYVICLLVPALVQSKIATR